MPRPAARRLLAVWTLLLACSLVAGCFQAKTKRAEAHRDAAADAIARNDVPTAVRELEAAVVLRPADRDLRVELGAAHLLALDYQKAATELATADTLAPPAPPTESRYATDVIAYKRGCAAVGLHRYRDALGFWETAIADADNLDAMNDLSWLLATCPDSTLQDGKRAFELATQVNQATLYADPNHLDTLAAAAARDGKFDDAIRAQAMAIDHLPANTDPTQVAGFHERATLYAKRQALTDPQ